MMSAGAPDKALERVVGWLGELGGRWGLPPDACRVHGWLYLTGRSAAVAEMAEALDLTASRVEAALAWIEDHRLAERDAGGRWRTGDDPWELVMRSLERRRDRELGPALELLRESRREAAADPRLADRIHRLLVLLDDIQALDAQARRFSSTTLRRLIGAGGRAARFLDGALGQGRRR